MNRQDKRDSSQQAPHPIMHPNIYSNSAATHVSTPDFSYVPMTPQSLSDELHSAEELRHQDESTKGSPDFKLRQLSQAALMTPPQRHRFKCTHPGCPKNFSTNGHLSRHMMIHVSNQRFPCTVPGCEKTFSRSDSANHHSRNHKQRLQASASTPQYLSNSTSRVDRSVVRLSQQPLSLQQHSMPVSASNQSFQPVFHQAQPVAKTSISFLID